VVDRGDRATVVFAEVEPHSLCLDPRDIERRITKRTKAILVVHYCAHPADMAVFDFSQNLVDVRRGSNPARKHGILDAVSLNRCVDDVTLVVEKRKPFDYSAERPFLKDGRGGPRCTFLNEFGAQQLLWNVLSYSLTFNRETFLATAGA